MLLYTGFLPGLSSLMRLFFCHACRSLSLLPCTRQDTHFRFSYLWLRLCPYFLGYRAHQVSGQINSLGVERDYLKVTLLCIQNKFQHLLLLGSKKHPPPCQIVESVAHESLWVLHLDIWESPIYPQTLNQQTCLIWFLLLVKKLWCLVES